MLHFLEEYSLFCLFSPFFCTYAIIFKFHPYWPLLLSVFNFVCQMSNCSSFVLYSNYGFPLVSWRKIAWPSEISGNFKSLFSVLFCYYSFIKHALWQDQDHVFFFAEYRLYQKTAGHLGGRGGAHPLHPPPRSAPAFDDKRSV